MTDYSDGFLDIQQQFCIGLKAFQDCRFGGKVDLVQSPYQYAFGPYSCCVEDYLTKQVPVLFLGLNADPHGMCKTGIPFGDIKSVVDWLEITGTVQRVDPTTGQVDDIPLENLTKEKGEMSGSRFWGLIQELCGSPEQFFENCFVHNYCPLGFSLKNGNVNPSKFILSQRRPLEKVCDEYLAKTIQYLDSRIIVAFGNYAEERANAAKNNNSDLQHIEIVKFRHPSSETKMIEEEWRNRVKETIKNTAVLQPYFQ